MLLEHSIYTKEELESYRTYIAEQEAEIKSKLSALKQEASKLGQMKQQLIKDKQEAEKVFVRRMIYWLTGVVFKNTIVACSCVVEAPIAF